MNCRLIGLSKVVGASTIAIGTMTAGNVAYAQEAGPKVEEVGAGEIIVTAQRREESANRVPISITAMSGDQLQEMNIRDVADLTRVVPGFTEAKSAGGTQ